MVVLQQGEHSSVNNSRPAGKEDRYKKKGSDRDIGENEEKEKGSEEREPLIIFHGPTKDLDLFMWWWSYK